MPNSGFPWIRGERRKERSCLSYIIPTVLTHFRLILLLCICVLQFCFWSDWEGLLVYCSCDGFLLNELRRVAMVYLFKHALLSFVLLVSSTMGHHHFFDHFSYQRRDWDHWNISTCPKAQSPKAQVWVPLFDIGRGWCGWNHRFWSQDKEKGP